MSKKNNKNKASILPVDWCTHQTSRLVPRTYEINQIHHFCVVGGCYACQLVLLLNLTRQLPSGCWVPIKCRGLCRMNVKNKIPAMRQCHTQSCRSKQLAVRPHLTMQHLARSEHPHFLQATPPLASTPLTVCGIGLMSSRSNISITMATKRCISIRANHLPGHWYRPPPNPMNPGKNCFRSRSQSNQRSYSLGRGEGAGEGGRGKKGGGGGGGGGREGGGGRRGREGGREEEEEGGGRGREEEEEGGWGREGGGGRRGVGGGREGGRGRRGREGGGGRRGVGWEGRKVERSIRETACSMCTH